MSTRVLLAESDFDFQRAVARILNDEQIEAVCAGDGRDALCLLNETVPDLLIADCALRGKNGYELCQYVREEPDFQTLPVILLDDHFDASNKNLAFGVGADAYLSKPFEPGELIRLLHDLLGSKVESSGRVIYSPGLAHSSEQVLTDRRTIDARSKPTGSPEAAPARGRDGLRFLWWGLLMGAIIAAVALALLMRTPDIAGPTLQSPQPSGVNGSPAPAQQEDMNNVEEAFGYSEDGKPSAVSADEDVKAIQTGPPDSSTEPADNLKTETIESESKQAVPADAPREDARDTGIDRASAGLTRPRAVRTTRENTISSHFKRSGREMKQAGKHIATGTKHFGQGSGKASIYAGEKISKGAKRLGAAFKKMF
ncbi:MAG TPA: response regulator [Blastocatellia bacterium]|nr:response regulator [Blastocatellia bacterium]